MQLLAVLLSVACAGSALRLPNYVKPCARNDPKFNECAMKHAQEVLKYPGIGKGDRKYNLPALDPLKISEVKVTQGVNGLSMTLKDLRIHGLLQGVVEKTDFDFDKKHIKMKLTFPKLMNIAKYETEGRIQVLPIKGNGDLNITDINSHIEFECDYKLEPRSDGKVYMVVTNPRATSNPERVIAHLTNLFNGNELLGRQMNQFLNENWKEVHKEVGPAFGEAIAATAHSIINSIIDNVPFDEAFPETV